MARGPFEVIQPDWYQWTFIIVCDIWDQYLNEDFLSYLETCKLV